MSYPQRPSASLEALIDYVVSVIAGLEAIGLDVLAAPWLALLQTLRSNRDSRDDARFALLRAQRKFNVRDAQWDEAISDLSGRAYLAAGKDAKALPYQALFGGVTANDARNLGPAKAAAVADVVLAKGAQLAHPDLATSLQRLQDATASLNSAADLRSQTRIAVATHAVVRIQRLADVDTAVGIAEAGILSAFPGRRDLCGLRWHRCARRRLGRQKTRARRLPLVRGPIRRSCGHNTAAAGIDPA